MNVLDRALVISCGIAFVDLSISVCNLGLFPQAGLILGLLSFVEIIVSLPARALLLLIPQGMQAGIGTALGALLVTGIFWSFVVEALKNLAKGGEASSDDSDNGDAVIELNPYAQPAAGKKAVGEGSLS